MPHYTDIEVAEHIEQCARELQKVLVDKLNKALSAHNISYKDIAEFLGADPGYIHKVLHGRKGFSLTTFFKISTAAFEICKERGGAERAEELRPSSILKAAEAELDICRR